jgi:hypothetical protein
MALSWRNLPCALKAAIGIGKRTLGALASLPRHRGRSKAYCGPSTRATIPGRSPEAELSDWGWRFPTIVAAVKALAVRSCIIDGELIACDANGPADFQLLRWRKRDDPAILCAFDLIELDGRDLRDDPIEERKAELVRLLTGCQPLALVLNRVFDEAGSIVFEHACKLGQEARLALRARPVEQLAQGEEPGRTGGAAGARSGLGRIKHSPLEAPARTREVGG